MSRCRLRSSGEGSSHEDPDIREMSPSSDQKQIHQVVSRDFEIDEDSDLDAIEIISTGNSGYKKRSLGYYEEALPKRLCKNERGMIVEDEIDMRFKSFKQFDIVQDHSDHAFSRLDILASSVSVKDREIISPTRDLIKRIHYEWEILKEALPETIYVRAYEGRMDLLSAVIVGPAGTPYHDGLFFFDIYLHPNYPESAPYVKYHSIGLSLHPQFGSAGNVCVSLLSGFEGECEAWCPSKSTILQLLLFLQGLVLTANPLFNDNIFDGFSRRRELPNSDMQMKSRALNETYFLASCRTMLYTLRRPPKHFEDLISGHFRRRGRAILTACLAYLHGAQVGCVDEDVNKGDSSSNSDFRISLGCLIRHMMREFTAKGADCNDLRQKVKPFSTAAAKARAKKRKQYGDSHHLQDGLLKNAIDGVPMYKVPPMNEDVNYED